MKRTIPYAFVLELLQKLHPVTKPMFGCYGVYVRAQMVLVLRQREKHPQDNGVWIASTREHHESLLKDFPDMRSVSFLGKDPTGMQVLSPEFESFEPSVEKLCQFILAGDPRIGSQRKK